MRIAVIGAGLFGCTAAVYAARQGHDVDLFEKRSQIMSGASTHNQFRLHRGYHYPRSPQTGRQSRAGLESFVREYGNAVITPQKRKQGDQLYAIARKNSKTGYGGFQRFCEDQDLPHRAVEVREPLLNPDHIEGAFAVLEAAIDPRLLQVQVQTKLDQAGVVVGLDCGEIEKDAKHLRNVYDQIIVATYDQTNVVLRQFGVMPKPLQFELVEKPVIKLPDKYRFTSIVVMDGPFCCVDPYGMTGNHLLGHVDKAIHCTAHGDRPFTEIGKKRWKGMLKDATRYMPFLADARHVESFYVNRAVQPDVDDTDERLTQVTVHDDQLISIFSGKLGTAVDAAQEVMFAINRKESA